MSLILYFTIQLHAGKFFIFFLSPADFVSSKLTFSKNSYRNTIRVSNSLSPDQAQHFVGPDLDPNCLQRLSADDSCKVKSFS